MEELKSCLFCGKPVDRDYAYCPWCGYEFGPGDDVPVEPAPAESAAAGQSVLLRLTSLEELLSDMERELDLILKTSSADP